MPDAWRNGGGVLSAVTIDVAMVGGSPMMWPKIAADLAEAIRDGSYRIGDIIPGSVLLARKYRVGRATVRRAIDALTAEGTLRAHGGRTIVVGTAPDTIRRPPAEPRIRPERAIRDRGWAPMADTRAGDSSWRESALCAQTDPEAFFPDKGGSPDAALAVCRRCSVTEACLTWAVDNHIRFGVWGGLSERERRQLKRRQAAS